MNRRTVVVREGSPVAQRPDGRAADRVIPRNLVDIREYVARFERLNHLHPTVVVLGEPPEGPLGG